jgi:hypothetical protein
MIIDSIILAIFVASLGGTLLILLRKMPTLNTLPENGSIGIKKHQYIVEIENKIKDILITFEKQVFFHKILSWIKVITLKIEVNVDHLLHSIRKKAQEIDRKNGNGKSLPR